MSSEKLTLALEQHQAGRLAEAEQLYRAALDDDPDNADAWHLLGMVAHQAGDNQRAVELIRRAIALSPDFADYHNNLGTIHYALGDLASAEACCREAIRWRPSFAQAHNNLGNALAAAGRYREALDCYEAATACQPHYPGALAGAAFAWRQLGELEHAAACCQRALQLDAGCLEALNNLGGVQLARGQYEEAAETFRRALASGRNVPEIADNLGTALQMLGRCDEAIDCHREAISQRPDFVAAHIHLAAALRRAGRYEQAEQPLRQALALAPNDARIHNDLGELLWRRGRRDEASRCFRRAIDAQPELALAHFNLANALRDAGLLDDSERSYREALAREPNHIAALTNLAITLCDHGRTVEALELFQQAHQLAPEDPRVHSHLLVCRQYVPGAALEQLAADHAEWARRHAAGLRDEPPCAVANRHPERRLRVGLVSRDFRLHPVAFLLVSALEALDRAELEVVCYADQVQSDDMTRRIRQACDLWQPVAELSDEQLADRIRQDGTDVLVDLAGHTAGNRLLVFARRPAPVQVTWLGYVGTTGLDAIGYLLSDRLHTPAGVEQHFVEAIVRLPDGYACYAPPGNAPAVSELPMLASGHATFGCFNNPAKVTDAALALWSAILGRVPGSHLLLKYTGLDSAGAVAAFRERFDRAGIDPQRVTLEGHAPHRELLARYASVDVALDTFPYSGGVTTCEAVWMGAPVVTWPGETFASRHALSHLTTAGVAETIAATPQEYIDLAVELVSDPQRLARIRQELRPRVAASPLCDAQRFARGFESVLRVLWRRLAQ